MLEIEDLAVDLPRRAISAVLSITATSGEWSPLKSPTTKFGVRCSSMTAASWKVRFTASWTSLNCGGETLVAGCVCDERATTGRSIGISLRVVRERTYTDGRVEAACCVVIERLKTNRRVVFARCDTEEGLCSLSRVAVGIAPIRRW